MKRSFTILKNLKGVPSKKYMDDVAISMNFDLKRNRARTFAQPYI